ncbi:YidC/Oxa1 family insertase periplasmic-domain containing protein [Paludisphaera sp.]|uniref:membrane protein insertase YidC n=1 Tax=Paludisphaera sp. TaxID=2017432 RepID=UPI00301E23A5
MSNERRLILFVMLTFLWVLGFPLILQKLGWAPAPAERKPVARADADPAAKPDEAKSADSLAIKAAEPRPTESGEAGEAKPEAEKPRIEVVPPADLTMGSLEDRSPGGYHFQIQLDQKGAGVASVLSSRYDADFEGRVNPHRPMQLIGRDPSRPVSVGTWPPSLSLTLSPPDVAGRIVPMRPAERMLAAANGAQTPTEDLLDAEVWEVVRDDQGRAVRPLSRPAAEGVTAAEGQEVVFRATADDGVIVTKTYRLWKGEDGFDFLLKFESPDRPRTFAYNLLAPYGIPIEGEWYTATFREVFFGTAAPGGKVNLTSHTAYEIAKATDKPIESTVEPLRFTGVENQYFAILLAPVLGSAAADERIDRESQAVLLERHPGDSQKSDVGVRIHSRPITIGPNVSREVAFKVFAGPKTEAALAPYGASDLAVYRKGMIPLATSIARYFISPILSLTYGITERVASVFGGTRGNYGLAIILLTMIVKLMLFPLGRKQAMVAQRMQHLQPHLKALQEKYKDDKEKLTRETFALYKKHNANPVAGCVPALVQIPIFVGLWQALNSSVALRQAPFLWINDLAAPDMLFRMPFDVPFLGHWFNLLPILVVGLMIFQTHLFSPPATTPEMEMQQKTMKYMMVVMAVMFYKVPSGLGIYFIVSSLWSIGERLLLPKIIHEQPLAADDAADKDKGKEKDDRSRGGPPAPPKPAGGLAQFWSRVLEEAKKDPTYRKVADDRAGSQADPKRDRNGDSDRPDRPRVRPKRK